MRTDKVCSTITLLDEFVSSPIVGQTAIEDMLLSAIKSLSEGYGPISPRRHLRIRFHDNMAGLPRHVRH